jgi:hypothetical protein
MNDMRQTLEDLAGKFEPPTDGFAAYLHGHQERGQRRQRVLLATLLVLLIAAASIAGIEASRASAAKFPTALHFSKAAATQPTTPPPPLCAANAHITSFTPTLSSSSGSPGSTVTVSGPLPVLDESGQLIGQTSNEVIAYWNLDLNHWTTALTSPLSPAAAVAGSAVELLGTQDVAGVCDYSFQVKIPTGAAPGTYPIQLLGESSDATGVATFPYPPANYQVTVG